MRRNTGHIIADGCIIDRSNHTGVGCRLFGDFWSHKVSIKSGSPVRMELCFGGHFHVISIHTSWWNDTITRGVTQRKGVVTFVESLGYIDVIAPRYTCFKKVLHVVICLWSSPRIHAGSCKLRNIVFSGLFTILAGVTVVCISSVGRVVSQFGNLRTPCERRWRIESTAWTLCIFLLKFRKSWNLIKGKVSTESNSRFSFICSFTTFGSDNDNTIGSSHTIQSRSSLSL